MVVRINTKLSGLDSVEQKNYEATTGPTINDDSSKGYEPGSKWLNKTTNDWFILSDSTKGAAIWERIDEGAANTSGIESDIDLLQSDVTQLKSDVSDLQSAPAQLPSTLKRTVVTVTASNSPYTASFGQAILSDMSSGDVEIICPSTAIVGESFEVIRHGSSNSLIVNAGSGKTINGLSTMSVFGAFDQITVMAASLSLYSGK